MAIEETIRRKKIIIIIQNMAIALVSTFLLLTLSFLETLIIYDLFGLIITTTEIKCAIFFFSFWIILNQWRLP